MTRSRRPTPGAARNAAEQSARSRRGPADLHAFRPVSEDFSTVTTCATEGQLRAAAGGALRRRSRAGSRTRVELPELLRAAAPWRQGRRRWSTEGATGSSRARRSGPSSRARTTGNPGGISVAWSVLLRLGAGGMGVVLERLRSRARSPRRAQGASAAARRRRLGAREARRARARRRRWRASRIRTWSRSTMSVGSAASV